MDILQRIKQNFNENIQTNMLAADEISDDIALAAGLMVQCLLGEHKIISCGNGVNSASALRFTAIMQSRYEAERPSLPAIALNGDATTLSAIANDTSFDEVYAKRVKALGNEGDVLLAISGNDSTKNIIKAIEAAHWRNIKVIALTGSASEAITSTLNENDIEIRIPSDIGARVQETHTLVIHCLCDIIDRQLFETGDN